MADKLNLDRPYIELGFQPKGQADYVWQDGQIFAWSESNIQYEPAWWLNVTDKPPLVLNLEKTRPFDYEWLKKVPGYG